MNQRGDTLVEVLLATVVMSIIVAGMITVSNRATRISQTSFERTDVSNLLREQAELIRANPLGAVSVAPAAGAIPESDPCYDQYGIAGGVTSFYVDSTSNPPVFTPGLKADRFYKIWVERVDGTTFVDFDVKACWEGIGGEVNQVTGLTVRLSKDKGPGGRP